MSALALLSAHSETVERLRPAAIRRTFDAEPFNAIANMSEVRPHLFGGDGKLDLTGLISNPLNFALACEHGGFVLIAIGSGCYEVHSIFRPGARAAPAAMVSACDWMFTRTDCQRVVSKVPKANRAAKGLAIKAGLHVLFEREDATFGPTEYVELTLAHWAMNNRALEAHGERFHGTIEAAKEVAGSSLPIHDHDPAHERAVGAALLMFERGQPVKAADFYNQWAFHAGYAPLTLLSVQPVTVDAVDAVVGLGEKGLEVQLCR